MSTDARLWALSEDYPPDVIYHDGWISPYCMDHLDLGSDYYYDFTNYVRVCVDGTFATLSRNHVFSAPAPDFITESKITTFEERVRQWPHCDWYKTWREVSFFEFAGHDGENLPKGAQGFDETHLQKVLTWLRENTGRRLMMEVN